MVNQQNEITLVVFTCQGREHLLTRTLTSFFSKVRQPFARFILSVDGPFSEEVIARIQPDLVVQNRERKGYVQSIQQVLALITTPWFFWLEDDWQFHADPHIPEMISRMQQHEEWLQVVYSKYGRLPADFKQLPAGNDLYQNPAGFSANPCICATVPVQEAFEALRRASAEKTTYEGFEEYLGEYFAAHKLVSMIHDPVNGDVITHEGFLESTDRAYHSVSFHNQQRKGAVPYISGFGGDRQISWISKVAMIPKLMVAMVVLMAAQFNRREAYDYAMRIYFTFRQGFRN